MVVATLYSWQADPLFLAAEEVQDSADRLQSSFHQWQLLLQRQECGDEPATRQTYPQADNDDDGDSIWPVRSGDDEDVVVVTVDQQVDEEGVRLVMLCACDTLKWQLEAFERAARDDEWRAAALGEAPSSVNDTRERRRQFVSAIRAQLQQVQAVIRPAIGAASPAAASAIVSGSSDGSSGEWGATSSAISGVDSGGITVAFPSGLAAAASNASSRAAAAAAAAVAVAAEAAAASGTDRDPTSLSPSRPSPFRVAGVSSDNGHPLDSRLVAFLTPTRVAVSRSSSGGSTSSFMTIASTSSSSVSGATCSSSVSGATSSSSVSGATSSSSDSGSTSSRSGNTSNSSSSRADKIAESDRVSAVASAPAALVKSASPPVTAATTAATAAATAAAGPAISQSAVLEAVGTAGAGAAAAAAAAAGAAAGAAVEAAAAAFSSSASAVSTFGRWIAGSPTRALDGSGGADVAADDWLRVRPQAIRVSLSEDEEEEVINPLTSLQTGSEASRQPSAAGNSACDSAGNEGTGVRAQTYGSDVGGSQLSREHSDSEHAPLFGGGAGRTGRGAWWGQQQQRRRQQPSWQCLVYWLRQIQRPGESAGAAGGAGGAGAAGAAGYGEKDRVGSGRLLLDGRMDMGEMELGLLQLNTSQVAQMNAHWPAQRLAEEDEEEEDQRRGNTHDDDAGENQRLVFGWQLSLHRKKQRPRSKDGGGKGGECEGEGSEGGAVVLMGMSARQLVAALIAIVGVVLLILLLLWSWSGVTAAEQQGVNVSSLPPPND
ncbi:hypothetical protein CLOM_g20388 [Closterium sp. NIES-68]|nr:hypothetical protein CLOM_g20388 [Closterium sp. NIES-68]GJP81677.1 hypothetical protein CLOP_g11820 [Closterium sp. NIES-67]